MPLFKVVDRDDLNESDVQLYRDKELTVLFPEQGGDAAADSQKGEKNGEESIETAQEDNPANEPMQRIRQEGYEEGIAQGRTEGREEGKKSATEELLPSLTAFKQAAQRLVVLEEQLISRLTPEIVRLALEIAAKVVEKQVEEDREIIASVLARAQLEIQGAQHVRILLNPVDHGALMSAHPDLITVGEDGNRKIDVVSSEEICRGGCRIETELGVLDATIPTQLEEIKRQLLDGE